MRLWARVGERWALHSVLEEAHKGTVRSIAFAPDSKFLATASFDATVEIFERDDATGGPF